MEGAAMAGKISVLYQRTLPADFYRRLEVILSGQDFDVFFRADDIGIIDAQFTRMMELFYRERVPLCLAVVPQWITRSHWLAMKGFLPEDRLWCWHQHGYSHQNHEVSGKKNEFGESRPEDEVRKELEAGYERLRAVIGDSLFPIFTPPWNRCSRTMLALLQELGFRAVSRSIGVEPESEGLPDLFVNVDLHTGKEQDPQEAMERILTDCQRAVQNGRVGIMLHHRRMNNHAFLLLEQLLRILKKQERVRLNTFRELLGCDE